MAMRAALEHLRAGARADALASLVDAWRACRNPGLAATIDVLAASVPSERPGGKTVEAKQEAWLKCAKRSTAAQIGGLLASLVDIRKAEPLRDRIWKLSERPHDPRIAAAMVAMIENPPILGATFRLPLAAATAVIVETCDRRQVTALDRILRDLDNTRTAKGRGYIEDKLPTCRASLAAAIAKLDTELDAADTELLAQFDAELAATAPPVVDRAPLLAAVYADPEDDAARSVLSDELQGAGDPRGEFIALQLARGRGGAKTKRERELLTASGRDWLGRIEPLIAKTGVSFERGFLATCTLRDNDQHVFAQLADAPEWRTVEDVDIASAWIKNIDVVKNMPALRRLRGGHVSHLAASAPFLERLELRPTGGPNNLVGRDFPALRHLAIDVGFGSPFASYATLWATPLVRQLETLEVSVYDHDGWIRPLLELGVPTLVVAREYNPWQVQFVGATATLIRQRTPAHIEHWTGLAQMIPRVPRSYAIVVDTDQALPAEIAALVQNR